MYCVEQKTGFAQDPDGPPLPAVLSRSHCCDHRWRSPRSCRLFSRLRVAPPSTFPGTSRPLRSMSTPCGADTFQRAGPAEPCPENQGSSNPAAWSLSPALAPPHVASSGRRNGSPQMPGGTPVRQRRCPVRRPPTVLRWVQPQASRAATTRPLCRCLLRSTVPGHSTPYEGEATPRLPVHAIALGATLRMPQRALLHVLADVRSVQRAVVSPPSCDDRSTVALPVHRN